MNQLSKILYWADVLPHLATWLCVVSFLCFALFSLLCFLGFTGFCGDEANGHDYAKTIAPRFRRLWPLPVLFFLLWGVSFLVPSKDTFYAIAVSETGEQVLKTPEVGKARQALNAWLDKQIKEETQPEEGSK